MNEAKMKQHRHILQQIARRVLLERGLLADFSPEALSELNAIQSPAGAESAGIRDLSALLWASIDNDDSLDLDQLTKLRVKLVNTDVNMGYIDLIKVSSRR